MPRKPSKPRPLTLRELTIALNKALDDCGFGTSFTENEVGGAFYATDVFYDVYGFRSTKGDHVADSLLEMFPDDTKVSVLVASLEVSRKNASAEKFPPSEYWVLDLDAHEIYSFSDACVHYGSRCKEQAVA